MFIHIEYFAKPQRIILMLPSNQHYRRTKVYTQRAANNAKREGLNIGETQGTECGTNLLERESAAGLRCLA